MTLKIPACWVCEKTMCLDNSMGQTREYLMGTLTKLDVQCQECMVFAAIDVASDSPRIIQRFLDIQRDGDIQIIWSTRTDQCTYVNDHSRKTISLPLGDPKQQLTADYWSRILKLKAFL